MSFRRLLTTFLHEKKWFLLALLFTLAVLWGSFCYLGMTQTPVASLSIGPVGQPERWSFALADGTPLAPDEAGNFTLPSGDTVIYCTRSLEEYQQELTSSALLSIDFWNCNVAILADGRLVADPSHCFLAEEGRFDSAAAPSTNGGLFTLGDAGQLTLAVQFLSDNASVSALPSVTLFSEPHTYYSQWMALTAKAALPAGVFLAAALFLAALFLFQLYHKKANWDFLLLALLALSFCLQSTVPYSVYVLWVLQTPLVMLAIYILPFLLILWLLWYHTDRGMRRWLWGIPAFCTLSLAVGIVWRLADNPSGARWTNLFQGKLLPLCLLLALLACGWQAYRGNKYYRRFFCWGGGLALCAGAALFLSFLEQGSWWQSLRTLLKNTAMLRSFFQLIQAFSYLLLLLFFLLAVYDFIQGIVRRNQEVQALTLQNRYASQHAAYLRKSLDQTYTLRHEMRHHIDALKALCKEGDLQRISSYVERLGGEIGSAPSHYSDNPLVNTLVSSCAEHARSLGADFQCFIQVPERVEIQDTDLTVLLSNLIDNALEALAQLPDPKQRQLRLRVETFEHTGLFLSCTNTFSGHLRRDDAGALLSTKDGEGHGLGLKAMRRVAEKYNSVLIAEPEGHLFQVKTYLYFR